ncbi:MAG: HAD family hydrolase [Phycisphaerales bacterium]|nr:HAD family hydrolase [Phycisphaerales bacterium]
MTTKRTTPTTCRIVIFDMDGTLTRPNLDFDRIREEIGLGIEDEPILEAMSRMTPGDRARTQAILQRHEDKAAAESQLQPGAAEVVSTVRASGIPAVLMTRNSRRSVGMFNHRHRIEFDLTWTREDGPMKPSPEPVIEICRRFEVDPADAWVVGDFHYDIRCGAAAGSTTVLLLDPESKKPDWADEADFIIYELPELLTHSTITHQGDA